MDFFDRHKALIITTLLFSVLMLGLYNFKLSSNNDEVSEMLVQLDQMKLEEQEKEETRPQEKTQPDQRKVQTHQAYNQDKKTREADFKKRLDDIFEKNSAEQEEAENENSENAQGNYSMNRKNSEEKKTRSDGNDNSEEVSQKSAAYDYSSISFSLKGRNAVKIPNPVYTCDVAGKIVVNIVVDERGYVIENSINKGSSNTSNECLEEQALEYSAGARFTKLAGENSQPGTITYYFKS